MECGGCQFTAQAYFDYSTRHMQIGTGTSLRSVSFAHTMNFAADACQTPPADTANRYIQVFTKKDCHELYQLL